MKTFLIACAGVLALSAGAANAQETAPEGTLPTVDANGDGQVDTAEFDAYLTTSFTALDANGDGYVTEAESAGSIPADLYASANANGDDGISLQEFQAQGQKDFAAADKNG